MHLSEEEFSKLTELCRIECTPEEKDQLFFNISKILSYISLLDELGTQDIEPCYQVLEAHGNVFREDVVGNTLSSEEFFQNVPSKVGALVRIPTILNVAT